MSRLSENMNTIFLQEGDRCRTEPETLIQSLKYRMHHSAHIYALVNNGTYFPQKFQLLLMSD